MLPRVCLSLCVSSVLVACGEEGERPGDSGITAVSATMSQPTGVDPSTGPTGTGGDDSTGAGSGSSAPTSSGGVEPTSSGGETEGVKLDVGGAPDFAMPAEDGCKKVDVLYVIDNSPSMYDEQKTLIQNFGTFTQEMQAALQNVEDYHIGVITTDNYATEGFFDDSTPVVNDSEPLCKFLGGMVVESQAGLCTPFASGLRYITQQDDLASKFACVADVGEDGDSDERVGDALIGALSPANNAPGACNEGFSRPDALLIVVILTDENDSSDASVQEWYDAVVGAVGKPENTVVLSLIWDESEPTCSSELSETTGSTIREFTEMFPNHAVGDICANSYAGFFAGAVPVIDSACDNIIPN